MKVTINVTKRELKELNEILDNKGPITDEAGLRGLIIDLLSAVRHETIHPNWDMICQGTDN